MDKLWKGEIIKEISAPVGPVQSFTPYRARKKKRDPSSINLRGTRKINNTILPKILDYEAFILPPAKADPSVERTLGMVGESVGRISNKSCIKKIKFYTTVSMKIKIILLLLPICLIASGGYDNGTATGKGQFQIDLTWNPFNQIHFGQTYIVMSYGLSHRLDIHGYISHHTGGYQTWYGGFFYQFLKTQKLDLATAVGVRRRFDENWTHIFAPQLLYTIHLNDRLNLGGSVVNIMESLSDKSRRDRDKRLSKLGVAVDVGVFYRLKYKSQKIESVSIGIGGFHPATWKPDTYFLPTYSIDIKFR